MEQRTKAELREGYSGAAPGTQDSSIQPEGPQGASSVCSRCGLVFQRLWLSHPLMRFTGASSPGQSQQRMDFLPHHPCWPFLHSGPPAVRPRSQQGPDSCAAPASSEIATPSAVGTARAQERGHTGKGHAKFISEALKPQRLFYTPHSLASKQQPVPC